jgi:hypothetical protein
MFRPRASYFDRPDTSDRVFYIYNLARYNNKPHYHYGVTHDLLYTEFLLRSRVPIYKRICYHPIDTTLDCIDRFEKIIADKRVLLPVFDIDNVFAIEDSSEMQPILDHVDAMFSKK